MTTTISAVILAGGLGRRMGGVDKGLQLLQNKPLFHWVLDRLHPQISHITINANRNQATYAEAGFPVFADQRPDFQGPLSGIATALERATSDFVLFVPCDSPFFPLNLVEKLKNAVETHRTLIAYACDEQREHPTFCLISTQLKEKLAAYLDAGERKMLRFMQQNAAQKVFFSHQEGKFVNFNQLEDLQKVRMDKNPD